MDTKWMSWADRIHFLVLIIRKLKIETAHPRASTAGCPSRAPRRRSAGVPVDEKKIQVFLQKSLQVAIKLASASTKSYSPTTTLPTET